MQRAQPFYLQAKNGKKYDTNGALYGFHRGIFNDPV